MSRTIERSPALTGEWTVDPTHSTIGFRILYMGIAPFEGAFREFSATLDQEGLRGTAKASSIDVDNEQLTEHLASPDFFDSASHPTVVFEGGPVQLDSDNAGVVLDGVLEVKGNRVPITLTGTLTQPVTDPYGTTKRGLTLAGAVDRNLLGVTWNAPLPEGGSMLGDEVELSASLLLVASEER